MQKLHTNYILDRLSDVLNENPLLCNIFTSQGRSSFTPRKVENTSSARTTKYDKCCESSTRWLLHEGFKKCEGRENDVLASPLPLSASTTLPAFIEWQCTIHRSLPHPKIWGQKAKMQPLRWLYKWHGIDVFWATYFCNYGDIAEFMKIPIIFWRELGTNSDTPQKCHTSSGNGSVFVLI